MILQFSIGKRGHELALWEGWKAHDAKKPDELMAKDDLRVFGFAAGCEAAKPIRR